METKEIIRNIREKNNLTQEQFAELIHVTRQAVSRWENGETQPDTEQLKTLSKEFGVSINTLLGSPQTLFCQCCGMPLSDGNFTYKDKDSLLDFLVSHMPNPDNQTEAERRRLYDSHLSMLKHWR